MFYNGNARARIGLTYKLLAIIVFVAGILNISVVLLAAVALAVFYERDDWFMRASIDAALVNIAYNLLSNIMGVFKLSNGSIFAGLFNFLLGLPYLAVWLANLIIMVIGLAFTISENERTTLPYIDRFSEKIVGWIKKERI